MNVFLVILAVLGFLLAGAFWFGIIFAVIGVDNASERARALSRLPGPRQQTSRPDSDTPLASPERAPVPTPTEKRAA